MLERFTRRTGEKTVRVSNEKSALIEDKNIAHDVALEGDRERTLAANQRAAAVYVTKAYFEGVNPHAKAIEELTKNPNSKIAKRVAEYSSFQEAHKVDEGNGGKPWNEDDALNLVGYLRVDARDLDDLASEKEDDALKRVQIAKENQKGDRHKPAA